MQLGQVRHAGQRRQVRSQRQHRRGRVVGLVVSPELDEGVDLDRASSGRSRRHVDGASRGLERRREFVLAELQAADPDEDERVVRRQATRLFERRFGRGIQRRIGRLADPLEEGEAEVALGTGIGRVRVDGGLQPFDLVDGRGPGSRWRAGGWAARGCRAGRLNCGVRRGRGGRGTAREDEHERDRCEAHDEAARNARGSLRGGMSHHVGVRNSRLFRMIGAIPRPPDPRDRSSAAQRSVLAVNVRTHGWHGGI